MILKNDVLRHCVKEIEQADLALDIELRTLREWSRNGTQTIKDQLEEMTTLETACEQLRTENAKLNDSNRFQQEDRERLAEELCKYQEAVSNLARKCETLTDYLTVSQRVLEDTKAERNTLLAYSRHKQGCKIRPDTPSMRALAPQGQPFVPVPCSCGFDDVRNTWGNTCQP